MFSRDCGGCDTVSATNAAQVNPYDTPRLSGIPHDIVRFNGRAEMHAPCGGAAAATAGVRRDATGRPLRSTLNRLRGNDFNTTTNRVNRHEDPSYENVHVQWHNGFEFGRSRDCEQTYQLQQQQRPILQRARSESPNFSTAGQRRMHQTNTKSNGNATTNGGNVKSAKYADPFKNYELNAENNTFKPKLAKIEAVDCVEALILPAVVMEISDDLDGAAGGIAVISVDDIGEGAAVNAPAAAVASAVVPQKNIDECANLNDNETELSTTKTRISTNNQNINGTNNEQKEN